LFRQSYKNNTYLNNNLVFNGDLVRMGDASDVLYENSRKDEIVVSITEYGYPELDYFYNLQFSHNKVSNETIYFKKEKENDAYETTDSLTIDGCNCSLFGTEPHLFKYLQAERMGSRVSFPKTNFQAIDLEPSSIIYDSGTLGISGEYTAHFLDFFGDKIKCLENMRFPNSESLTLNQQVEAWLSVISPNVRFHITDHASMDIMELKYSYGGIKGRVESKPYRSTNVGFGITYVLPIIVALLSTQEDGLVILENPEAHLHPQGQRYMGELIARAASSGIQVIVETHSDHVLNGIRLAVHKGFLDPEQTCFHYFERNQEGDIKITSPKINKKGRLDDWPDGFFDEWDKALFELV